MAIRGEAFSFDIEGLEELDRMLGKLSKTMRRNVLTGALKDAAKPTLEAAKLNVPKGETGNLRNSLIITPRLSRHQMKTSGGKMIGGVEVFVGSNAPHAHLVEFGTSARFTKKGAARGSMWSYPFLTNAWDKTKHEAYKILVRRIEFRLVRTASTLSKKAAKGTLGKAAVKHLST